MFIFENAKLMDIPFLSVQKSVASPGRGILAIDESNATCGKRLSSIGLDNTEANRQAYRQLLLTTAGLGEYISGAILFEETLYQSTTDGKKFVDCLKDQNIMPGIKVDKVCIFLDPYYHVSLQNWF
jgi:fructose-bisphosphate aldolase, class I